MTVQLANWVALRGTRTPSLRGQPRGLYATIVIDWPKLDISTLGWHTLAFSSGHSASSGRAAAAPVLAAAGEAAVDCSAPQPAPNQLLNHRVTVLQQGPLKGFQMALEGWPRLVGRA